MKKFLAVLLSLAMMISCVSVVNVADVKAEEGTAAEKTFQDGDTTYVEIAVPEDFDSTSVADYVFRFSTTADSKGTLSVYGVTDSDIINSCNFQNGESLPKVDLRTVQRIGNEMSVDGVRTEDLPIGDYLALLQSQGCESGILIFDVRPLNVIEKGTFDEVDDISFTYGVRNNGGTTSFELDTASGYLKTILTKGNGMRLNVTDHLKVGQNYVLEYRIKPNEDNPGNGTKWSHRVFDIEGASGAGKILSTSTKNSDNYDWEIVSIPFTYSVAAPALNIDRTSNGGSFLLDYIVIYEANEQHESITLMLDGVRLFENFDGEQSSLTAGSRKNKNLPSEITDEEQGKCYQFKYDNVNQGFTVDGILDVLTSEDVDKVFEISFDAKYAGTTQTATTGSVRAFSPAHSGCWSSNYNGQQYVTTVNLDGEWHTYTVIFKCKSELLTASGKDNRFLLDQFKINGTDTNEPFLLDNFVLRERVDLNNPTKKYPASGDKYSSSATNDYVFAANSHYDMTIGSLYKNNVVLRDDIGLNFIMDMSPRYSGDLTGATEFLRVSKPGDKNTEDILLVNGASQTIDEASRTVFQVDVAAKEMADIIQVQFFSDNDTPNGPVYSYSVKEYAEYILNGSYDQKTKDLVEAMLNYGAMAQTYFDHNTGNPANANCANTEDIEAVTSGTITLSDGQVATGNLEVTLEQVSLVLESKTALRFYFAVADGVTELTMNGQIPTTLGDYQYVEVDVTAADLAKWQTVAILYTGKESGINASYNCMAYCKAVIDANGNIAKDGKEEALVNLVKALYLYNQAAVAYQTPASSN